MKGKTRRIGLGLLSLMVVFMFAAGACGEEEKPTIIFSDLNWDSAQLQNAIAAKDQERRVTA